MNTKTSAMIQRLPTGQTNARNWPEVYRGKMNKVLTHALARLRPALDAFIALHPDWFYGTYTPYSFSVDDILVWHVSYEWGGHRDEGWIPPNLEVSFWKNGPTPLFKGKLLHNHDFEIINHMVVQFLAECPDVGHTTEIVEPWAVTYHFFSKNSKPRSRRKIAKKRRVVVNY